MSTPYWRLIAESDIYDYGYGEWKFLIYHYSPDAHVKQTPLLLSDLRLLRGNYDRSSKIKFITPTKIKFKIRDDSKYLFNRMQGDRDKNWKCIITKAGSAFFVGNILLPINPVDHRITNHVLKISVYDAFVRLKEYNDLSEIGLGNKSLNDILRTILNKLEYDLDLYCIMNMKPTPYGAYTKIFDLIGIDIESISGILAGANYYDILEDICKTFQIQIYQEGGHWILRQYHSMIPAGATVQTIDNSDGSSTVSTLDDTNDITSADLQRKLKKFRTLPIGRVLYTVPPYKKKDDGYIGFKNPDFSRGSEGWTVDAGTPVWNTKSVTLPQGSKISQFLDYSLSPGAKIIVKFNSLAVGYMLSTDSPVQSGLISVKFVEDSTPSNVWWLKQDGTWIKTPTEQYFVAELIPNYIYNGGSSYTVIDGYVPYMVDFEIESTIDIFQMAAGKITAYLHGGSDPPNGNPYDISAQHNFFNITLLANENTTDLPSNTSILSIADTWTGEVRKYEVDIWFHDEEPYNDANFINMNGEIPTQLWLPDSVSLLEQVTQDIIKFNREAMDSFEIYLLPGTTLDFTKLINSDLNGSTEYYLPALEDSLLISDLRRFIIIEHSVKSGTITTSKSFEIDVSGGISNYDNPGISQQLANLSVAKSLGVAHYYYTEYEFDYDNNDNTLYYFASPKDYKIVGVVVKIIEEMDSAAPEMFVKLNSDYLMETVHNDLTSAGFWIKDVDEVLSTGDTISIEYLADGSSQGYGKIYLKLLRRF